MNYLIKKTNNELEYCVNIKLKNRNIELSIEKKIKEIQKEITYKGFRKGKVPINIIFSLYEGQIRQDILNTMMKEEFLKIVNQEKINIISNSVRYLPENYITGNDFTYSVMFEIYPKFQLQKLSSIVINTLKVNITKKNIQNIISNFKTNMGSWKEVNRKIAINDKITLNYYILINNKKTKKYTIKNFVFILGKTHIIEKLEKKIINCTKNQTLFLQTNIDNTFNTVDLKYKQVTIEIFIKKIEEQIPISSTNELIKQLGIKKCSKDMLYEKINVHILKEIKKINRNYLKNQILQALITHNPIPIPLTLIKNEIQNLYNNDKNSNEFQLTNILEKKPKKDYFLHAKNRILVQLLLNKIIKKNKIKIDDKKVTLFLKKLIDLNIYSKNKILHLVKNTDFMNNISNTVLEEQSINFLIHNVKKNIKECDFEEAINYDNSIIL